MDQETVISKEESKEETTEMISKEETPSIKQNVCVDNLFDRIKIEKVKDDDERIGFTSCDNRKLINFRNSIIASFELTVFLTAIVYFGAINMSYGLLLFITLSIFSAAIIPSMISFFGIIKYTKINNQIDDESSNHGIFDKQKKEFFNNITFEYINCLPITVSKILFYIVRLCKYGSFIGMFIYSFPIMFSICIGSHIIEKIIRISTQKHDGLLMYDKENKNTTIEYQPIYNFVALISMIVITIWLMTTGMFTSGFSSMVTILCIVTYFVIKSIPYFISILYLIRNMVKSDQEKIVVEDKKGN